MAVHIKGVLFFSACFRVAEGFLAMIANRIIGVNEGVRQNVSDFTREVWEWRRKPILSA